MKRCAECFFWRPNQETGIQMCFNEDSEEYGTSYHHNACCDGFKPEEEEIVLTKITDVTDIEAFDEALDQCKGKVELHTSSGDVLNLRSELTKLTSLNVILGSEDEIDDLELYVEDPDDAVILMPLMIQ